MDLDGRRSGDVRTGIQQESEWPYSSHSRVHLPVMATSGRGRASVDAEEGEGEREPGPLAVGNKWENMR